MIIFNSPEIGKKIAKARKEKNLTQAELADYLGVSYQAVSNWERGQSMPDIDKLADISEVLSLSLDDLLNKPGVKKNIVALQTPDAPVSDEVLTEFAPIIKPKQLSEKMETATPNLEQLTALAPFLNSDVLAAHLKKVLPDNVPLKTYLPFAPFLDDDDLDNIIDFDHVLTGAISLKDIQPLLPFLSDEKCDELLEHVSQLENISPNDLQPIFPFVSDEALFNFIKRTNYDINWLLPAAPFLEAEQVGELFNRLENTDAESAAKLFPFLDDQDVAAYVKKNFDDEEKIKPALPFLDDDDLGPIFVEQLKTKTLYEVQYMLPFVDEEYLVEGVKMRMAQKPDHLFEELKLTFPFLPQDALNDLFLK